VYPFVHFVFGKKKKKTAYKKKAKKKKKKKKRSIIAFCASVLEKKSHILYSWSIFMYFKVKTLVPKSIASFCLVFG